MVLSESGTPFYSRIEKGLIGGWFVNRISSSVTGITGVSVTSLPMQRS